MNTIIANLALPLLLCACAFGFRAAAAGAIVPSGSQLSDDPPETVRYLVSLRHGPQRTSERGRILYEQIKQNPERYAEAVRQHVVLPDDDDTLQEWGGGHSARLARAIHLAEALGKEHGGPILLKFLRASRKRVTDLRNAIQADQDNRPAAKVRTDNVLRTLHLLRVGTLTAMTNLEDPAGIDDVMTTIGQEEDDSTRSMMLRYLQAVARGNEEVAASLRRMVDDPASPLHDDPDAARVLHEIANGSEKPKGSEEPEERKRG